MGTANATPPASAPALGAEPGTRSAGRPDVLFLPVTGDRGMGEYARCVLLAVAVRNRWPSARIRLVVSHGTPHFEEDRFERHTIHGSPTFNTPSVNDLLRRDPPEVAVFDNSGRTAQLACAHRLGIRTVFLSSRPTTRRKGFRLRRLRHTDQFWILRSGPERAEPSAWQRFKLRIAGGPEMVWLDTLLPESKPEDRMALRERLGIPPGPYILFSPGGGRWSIGGRQAGDLFAEAARQVADASGIRCVVVLGDAHSDGPPAGGGLVTLRLLNPSHLAEILHDAYIAVIGGGSIVGQAFAQRRVCIAAPTGGSDQQDRIRRYSREGLLRAAEPDPGSVARAVADLLSDSVGYRAIRRRVDTLGLSNGLAQAVDSLERLCAGELARRTGAH